MGRRQSRWPRRSDVCFCPTRNKLIRQYIPKHTNFDEVTDKKIASIQKKINSRPRKKLKFETPKTEFFKRIA